MDTTKIEIEVPAGKTAEWVNGVLTLVDDKPVTERIKTFEDACEELGIKHPFVGAYKTFVEVIGMNKAALDLIAYLKLRIIAAALNEGWQPKFTKDEVRYYPWIYLYTKEEVENMTVDEKKNVWFFDHSYCGFRCGLAYSSTGWANADLFISARLAVKNQPLAEYFGKHFIDIWSDYVLIKK